MSKYNLEEGNDSLKRILLMMKYDNNKTLSENIQEQTTSLDYDISTIKNELDSFSTDEKKIVNILKKYKTKNDFNNLLKKYEELVGKDLGTHFGRSFTKNRDKIEWGDLSNHLKSIGIEMIQNTTNKGRGLITVFKDLGTEQDTNTITPSKYKACSGTYKLYCYNKPVIGKVQGCLGLKQDGYFGPKTQSALKSVGFGNGFTDQDIDKICKTSQKPNTQVRPKVKPVSTIKPRGIQNQTNTSQPTQPQNTGGQKQPISTNNNIDTLN